MALLCYVAAFVLAWIPIIKYVAWAAPLVIFLMEKESPFVKFHAMQAVILEGVSWVFSVVFGIIISASVVASYSGFNYAAFSAALGVAGILSVLLVIISIVVTVFAIIATVKAYGYYEYKIPVIGNLAMKFSKKGNTPM